MLAHPIWPVVYLERGRCKSPRPQAFAEAGGTSKDIHGIEGLSHADSLHKLNNRSVHCDPGLRQIDAFLIAEHHNQQHENLRASTNAVANALVLVGALDRGKLDLLQKWQNCSRDQSDK